MKFVMHRDRTIASTSGHAVEFKKGVPTHVPKTMYEEVMAAGGVPEGELEELDKTNLNGVEEPPAGSEAREQAIFEAFHKIATKGKRGDFSASGAPHPRAVTQLLGWSVDNQERDQLWAKFKALEQDD